MKETDRIKLMELYTWWVIAENCPRLVRFFIRELVILEARSYWGSAV